MERGDEDLIRGRLSTHACQTQIRICWGIEAGSARFTQSRAETGGEDIWIFVSVVALPNV